MVNPGLFSNPCITQLVGHSNWIFQGHLIFNMVKLKSLSTSMLYNLLFVSHSVNDAELKVHSLKICHLGHKPQVLSWLFFLLPPYTCQWYPLNIFSKLPVSVPLFCHRLKSSPQNHSDYCKCPVYCFAHFQSLLLPILLPQFSRTSILSCHTLTLILIGFQTSYNKIKVCIVP